MARICRIDVRQLRLALTTPYKLSYRTFNEFEPYLVIVHDVDGNVGFGEGHVSPGSSAETREGAWAFLQNTASRLIGQSAEVACDTLAKHVVQSPVATTAIATAIEMMLGSVQLAPRKHAIAYPLLAPVSGTQQAELDEEIEAKISAGFRTFKVKVGLDVNDDLARLRRIQNAVNGRGTLRTDANRAYSQADAIAFATGLDPSGIELFEQPCAAEDWQANAAVARVSRVPVMLDEPICSLADIDRAASIDGVAYLKIKLKRFGSLSQLGDALEHIKERGMSPVLGDGLGAEVACWMEACVAHDTITTVGEFNGYLKPDKRILQTPLGFADGKLTIPAGCSLRLDDAAVDAYSIRHAVHGHTA